MLAALAIVPRGTRSRAYTERAPDQNTKFGSSGNIRLRQLLRFPLELEERAARSGCADEIALWVAYGCPSISALIRAGRLYSGGGGGI